MSLRVRKIQIQSPAEQSLCFGDAGIYVFGAISENLLDGVRTIVYEIFLSSGVADQVN